MSAAFVPGAGDALHKDALILLMVKYNCEFISHPEHGIRKPAQAQGVSTVVSTQQQASQVALPTPARIPETAPIR